MPKPGKTHRGAMKRFTPAKGQDKVGIFYRSRANAGHLNTKKSHDRRARLSQETVVHKHDRKRIQQLIGKYH